MENALPASFTSYNFRSMNNKELLDSWILWHAQTLGRKYQNKELAADSGISPQYISALLNGRKEIGLVSLQRLARAFGVTQSEFLAGPANLQTQKNLVDDNRDGNKNQGNESGRDVMSGATEEELARARALNIVCHLSPVRLGQALTYLESLSENASEKKNIRNVS